MDGLKKILKKIPIIKLLYKCAASVKYDGVRITVRRIFKRMGENDSYNIVTLTDEDVENQRNTVFEKNVKFSIVVPLYNTKLSWLKDMINSVLEQTYGNVELCLADGSDADHSYVGDYCEDMAQRDCRIVYKKLAKNKGISENTNACLDLVTGDYIGLLDHDDVLCKSALYEVMKAICEDGADFIYTDEEVVSEDLKKHICPHFKPDFAIDNLRANNYICHFTVFKRELLEKSGKFRSECDGSQDHDIILRLTKVANKIVHIPKILYQWRACEGSVAETASAKPYTTLAGMRAVTDSLQTYGLKAEVDRSKLCPTIYVIKYELKSTSLISIIIKNKNGFKTLKRCIDSILQISTYKNYEIIVVDENSNSKKVLKYYEEICKNEKIKVVRSESSSLSEFGAYNRGANAANGQHLIFLNKNINIGSPDWMEEMLMYNQRDDVGIVGAKIICKKRVKNAGMILGINGVVGESHKNFGRSQGGYMGRLVYSQNVSAVQADCMMIKRSVFNEFGGFDVSYKVCLADVDLCLKARSEGYLVVWTPYLEVSEKKTLKFLNVGKLRKLSNSDKMKFLDRWVQMIKAGDPYYNRNFTLKSEDFSYEKST